LDYAIWPIFIPAFAYCLTFITDWISDYLYANRCGKDCDDFYFNPTLENLIGVTDMLGGFVFWIALLFLIIGSASQSHPSLAR